MTRVSGSHDQRQSLFVPTSQAETVAVTGKIARVISHRIYRNKVRTQSFTDTTTAGTIAFYCHRGAYTLVSVVR